MVPFEALTEEEKNAIENYIRNYANFRDRMDCSMDYLLRFWNTNKEHLFHLFGDKLILEKTISIQRPEELIVCDLENELLNSSQLFYRDYERCFRNMTFPLYSTRKRIMSLLDSTMLMTNIYDGSDFEIPVEGKNHPIQVHNGCKVMKVLGKIASAFEIDGFEEFRLAHSLILNQKTMEGTLCLSIHPLDYMTMSDNDCDWDSCMSWMNDGEYRQGTVEMMNSKFVIVAYLKAKNDMSAGGIEWSNKRWRELMTINEDLLLEVRQYPFHDDVLGNIVFDWVKSLFPEGTYQNELTDIRNDNMLYRENGHNVRIRISTDMMYNDVYGTRRSCLATHGVLNDSETDYYWFNYSGESECMLCGEGGYRVVPDERDLACAKCSAEYFCENCGDPIISYDDVIYVEGSILCPTCAAEFTDSCANCDEVFFKHNLTPVGHGCFCQDCLSNFKKIVVR